MSYIAVINVQCDVNDDGNNNMTNIQFSSLNYVSWALRLALKWASWDLNLTIYTPLELDRLTKDHV